jgi:gamma-butyrobetaine dioxygenase
VAAKRYLCAAEPGYFDALSEASVLSLRLQGGAMPAEEADAFRRLAHSAEAVRLRRWDEAAKQPKLQTPSFHQFRIYLQRSLK